MYHPPTYNEDDVQYGHERWVNQLFTDLFPMLNTYAVYAIAHPHRLDRILLIMHREEQNPLNGFEKGFPFVNQLVII